MRDPTKLNSRDIKAFLHNAQLGAAEMVTDEDIPAIYEYHKLLLNHLTTESKFTPYQLIAVLTTTAFALYMGVVDDNKKTRQIPRSR